MATPYGKAVRKLRIELGVKLKDMADALEMKSAYLSAVETGRKRITEKVFEQSIDYFEKSDNPKVKGARALLAKLVDQSQPECVIELTSKEDRDRELVVAFARKFSDLSDDQKKKLESVLDME